MTMKLFFFSHTLFFIFLLKINKSDHTVNYLGYWTDQGVVWLNIKQIKTYHSFSIGAYYYYNTEPNTTYGETMMDIYDHYSEGPQKLPLRHWNYDSWWYYKVPPIRYKVYIHIICNILYDNYKMYKQVLSVTVAKEESKNGSDEMIFFPRTIRWMKFFKKPQCQL